MAEEGVEEVKGWFTLKPAPIKGGEEVKGV